MKFDRKEYEMRWEKVKQEMEKHGYETLVVWQRSGGTYDRAGDVLWLTNYSSAESGQTWDKHGSLGKSFAAVIIKLDDEPILIATEHNEAIDMDQLPIENVIGCKNIAKTLADQLNKLNIHGKVAYVGANFLPVSIYEELVKRTPQIEWISEDFILRIPKKVKSEAEINIYKEAGKIVTKALNVLMEKLINCEPQSVAAAEAGKIVLEAGGGIHRIGINHGPHSEKHMWRNNFYGFTKESPQKGDIVRGWIYGPILKGYYLDPGRVAVAGGNPSPEQRRLIEGAVLICEEVLRAIKPGITPREVGEIGNKVALEVGYNPNEKGAALWDIYGHGLGNYFDHPSIPSFIPKDEPYSPGVDEPYEEGMVVGVESFLTHPGIGLGALELNAVVEKDGVYILDQTPTIFW